MHALTAFGRALILGLVSAILPSPERDRYARLHELDAPLWSFQLGFVQGVLGAGAFMMAGLAFMRPAATDQSMILLENWFPGLDPTHFQGVGLINWFAWFLYPGSWPLIYLALVGLVRCVAFAATREAVGEPLVWAIVRLVQAVRRRSGSMRREARLGPRRADRVLPAEDDALIVIACREKPEWTDAATIAIGDRHYRITAVEELPDGDWQAIAYHLREQKPGEIIRRLVPYTPPFGSLGPGSGRG